MKFVIPNRFSIDWLKGSIISLILCNLILVLTGALITGLKMKDRYFLFDSFMYDLSYILILINIVCLVFCFIGYLGGKYIFIYGSIGTYLAGAFAALTIVDAVGFDGLAVMMFFVLYITIGLIVGSLMQIIALIIKKKSKENQSPNKMFNKSIIVIYLLVLLIPIIYITGQHVVSLMADIEEDTPRFSTSFVKTNHDDFIEKLFEDRKYSDYTVKDLGQRKDWLSRLEFEENIQLSYQEGFIKLSSKDLSKEKVFNLYKSLALDIISTIEYRRYHAEINEELIYTIDVARDSGLKGFWDQSDIDVGDVFIDFKYSRAEGYVIWFLSPLE